MKLSDKVKTCQRYKNIELPNGFQFDWANYFYNPAFGNEYPAIMKQIEETETTITIKRLYFFRYYDKTAAIIEEIYNRVKNGEEWQVCKNLQEKTLETFPNGARYSLDLLLKYAK